MELTYEVAIKRLEEIVDLLEKGSISLDDSIKLYEEAVKLSDFCHKKLENAKQKITDLNEVNIYE